MKKIIVIAICLIVVCIFGCGQKEKKKETVHHATYVQEENPGIKVTYRLKSKNDKLTELEMNTSVDLKVFDEDEAESFQQSCKDTEKTFKDKQCVEYDYNITDDVLFETMYFDLTDQKAVKELKKQNVLAFYSDSTFSFKETCDVLENAGFTAQSNTNK